MNNLHIYSFMIFFSNHSFLPACSLPSLCLSPFNLKLPHSSLAPAHALPKWKLLRFPSARHALFWCMFRLLLWTQFFCPVYLVNMYSQFSPFGSFWFPDSSQKETATVPLCFVIIFCIYLFLFLSHTFIKHRVIECLLCANLIQFVSLAWSSVPGIQ